MPCTDCEALSGQSSSVPPHAALVFIGTESVNCGIAGNDEGENYRCTACNSYLYRHTGRLDTKDWSWASSPEEEAVRRAAFVHDPEEVRRILEPLGFQVRVETSAMGTYALAWKQLTATTYRPGRGPTRTSECALYVAFHFPSGFGPGDDVIRVGISGGARGGDYSGQATAFSDLDHLRAAAPQVFPYYEANVAYFLCPLCRGLKTTRYRRSDRKPFLGCINYDHEDSSSCRWTSPDEPDMIWPLG